MLNTALARRLFTTVFLLALVATPAFRRGAEAAPITYYVSKNGSNADGRSWATAWNELNQINWTAVQPGDTILVDGGSTSMTYTSTLTYGKSGTSTAPITIQLASDAGRNGKAIIFGGRSTLLPYCGQSGYVLQSARNAGIVTGGYSWIALDGTKWGGFDVHGHNQHGIQLSSSASNLTFRHLDIWDNGSSVQSGSTWYPDQKGVSLSGSNITFERVEIHDNGQDAFQSGGGVSNLTIRRSWLYNSRAHPTLSGEPFNECRHSDGIQIYGGGVQSGITVEDSIFGPSFMQGFILGDSNTCPGGSACATINNVTVRNTLIVGGHGTSGNAGLLTKPDPANPPLNYVIDRVTSVRDVGDQWWNMTIDGSGHTVTNSIFVGGYALHIAGSPSASNNCSWQVNDQNNIAVDGDPGFVDATYAGVGTGFADFDFSLGGGTQCAGRGTTITSVAVLKGAGSATPTPTPIPPTATPTRTPTPTATSLPLAFEAEACTIAAPFTVTSGTPTYVSQSVETLDPAQGGRAACTFSITGAGDYVVKMLVNAASSSADSVFLNVDAEPTSPTAIWDIGPTTGYEWRTASWRGTGTVSQPQFNPKVFTLSAGSHQLIVRGREANVKVDKITIRSQ